MEERSEIERQSFELYLISYDKMIGRSACLNRHLDKLLYSLLSVGVSKFQIRCSS